MSRGEELSAGRGAAGVADEQSDGRTFGGLNGSFGMSWRIIITIPTF